MRSPSAFSVASLGRSILAAAFMLAAAVPASAGYAHFMLDANTGKILDSDHGDTLNHPASLTKMMTLYMAFEAIHQGRLRWDQRISMTRRAASTIPLKLGVRSGDTLTVREAVLGMIVLSANDAAEAMCDHLAGPRGNCGAMLTRKARQLGMSRTTFRNGSGLPDPYQVTTARDMATLGLSLMRNYPSEYALFSTRSFAFRGRNIHGHNNLMYRYRGMDGIKTGYTDASGFNIVSAVNENGRRVIGVVMGGRTAASRDARMAALLDKVIPGAAPRRGVPKGKAVELASLQDDSGTPVIPPKRETQKKNRQAAIAPKVDVPDVEAARPEIEAARPQPQPAIVEQQETASAAPSGGGQMWQVQIAAVGSEDEARAVLEKARGRAGSALGGVMNFTQQAGKGVYRARFIGFNNRSSAENACQALHSSEFKCFVVGANG